MSVMVRHHYHSAKIIAYSNSIFVCFTSMGSTNSGGLGVVGGQDINHRDIEERREYGVMGWISRQDTKHTKGAKHRGPATERGRVVCELGGAGYGER